MRIGQGVARAIDGGGGIGIEVLLRVFFEIAAILRNIRRHTCTQGRGERLAALLRRPIDEQRPGFGMNQVIGASRANHRQSWRILAAREGQHVFTVLKAQNLPFLRRD